MIGSVGTGCFAREKLWRRLRDGAGRLEGGEGF